eukprot:SAG22_NODE_2897_length_2118_cov_2.553739_2_plen_127_part_00
MGDEVLFLSSNTTSSSDPAADGWLAELGGLLSWVAVVGVCAFVIAGGWWCLAQPSGGTIEKCTDDMADMFFSILPARFRAARQTAPRHVALDGEQQELKRIRHNALEHDDDLEWQARESVDLGEYA